MSFRTDRSEQKVQTQILEKQSDQGLHCLQFWQQFHSTHTPRPRPLKGLADKDMQDFRLGEKFLSYSCYLTHG